MVSVFCCIHYYVLFTLFCFLLRVRILAVIWFFFSKSVYKKNQRQNDQDGELYYSIKILLKNYGLVLRLYNEREFLDMEHIKMIVEYILEQKRKKNEIVHKKNERELIYEVEKGQLSRSKRIQYVILFCLLFEM